MLRIPTVPVFCSAPPQALLTALALAKAAEMSLPAGSVGARVSIQVAGIEVEAVCEVVDAGKRKTFDEDTAGMTCVATFTDRRETMPMKALPKDFLILSLRHQLGGRQ